MTNEEKLGYYYKQMQVVEQALIEAKAVGDMGRIFQMEAEKEKVQYAINWLVGMGVTPAL